MSYNDKYPDMSAMYAVQFEYENKLKDRIKELETELERTRKALDIAINVLNRVKDVKYEEYIDEKLEQINKITALEKSELENLEMLVNNVFK